MNSMVMIIVGFMLMAITHCASAHGGAAPAPSPSPSNDGAAVDQGIAYLLMLLALAVTYLIH